MEAFGDVSGHFKGLIKHDCEVVVVGIVVGDHITASRCPKRAVRKISDIKEAKWHDLKEVQKRRLIECFADNDDLEFGYAVFTADRLHKLECNYLLHQDVRFPPAWDLALTGYAYGELLFECGAKEDRRVIFHVDRVASKTQTKDMVEHVRTFVDLDNAFKASSEQTKGIQAADCLAGAVAEDYKRDTDWLEAIDNSRITTCENLALIQLENDLNEYDRTLSSSR